jgi:hypothetical protein
VAVNDRVLVPEVGDHCCATHLDACLLRSYIW